MTQPLNQAIIAQVLHSLRQGQLRRCLEMGFTEEDLTRLKQPELVSMLTNTSIPWCRIQVNREVFLRLLNQAQMTDDETTTIDRMLLCGGSSKLICDLYGLSQREVALRRRLLGLPISRGRWPDLPESLEHQALLEWNNAVNEQGLDKTNDMDMALLCLHIAEKHECPMAPLWDAIQQWIDDEKVKE